MFFPCLPLAMLAQSAKLVINRILKKELTVRCPLLILVLLLVPRIVVAQDEVIRNFTATDFERFIKNDVKKSLAEVKTTERSITYDIQETPYLAAFYTEGKFVLFFVHYDVKALKNPVTLAKINEWNVDAVIS